MSLEREIYDVLRAADDEATAKAAEAANAAQRSRLSDGELAEIHHEVIGALRGAVVRLAREVDSLRARLDG